MLTSLAFLSIWKSDFFEFSYNLFCEWDTFFACGGHVVHAKQSKFEPARAEKKILLHKRFYLWSEKCWGPPPMTFLPNKQDLIFSHLVMTIK